MPARSGAPVALFVFGCILFFASLSGSAAAVPERLFSELPGLQAEWCRSGSDRVTEQFCRMTPATLRLTGPDGQAVSLTALVARDASTRAAGFQHIHGDVLRRSAIFFDMERDGSGAFHMCNVSEPLDIVWLRSNGSILDARRMFPGETRNPAFCQNLYGPTRFGLYRYALEVPAGALDEFGFGRSTFLAWTLDVSEWQ